MVISKLMGGVGNQLFQYSLGKALAIHHNTHLKLDTSFFQVSTPGVTPRSYALGVFNIVESFAAPHEINSYINTSSKTWLHYFANLVGRKNDKHIVKEQGLHFQPTVFDVGPYVYLDGYWQSEQYFKRIEPTLRRELTFKHVPSVENARLLKLIDNCNSVSIHIRRGDYVHDSKTNQFHGVCPISYYTEAVNKIFKKVRKPQFFVFSDDIEWVKENIQLQYPTTYVSHNSDDKSYEDLRLMSRCKHQIIANSSFSWWGAWLNNFPDKIVVAPINWFNDTTINTVDLIPPAWVRI